MPPVIAAELLRLRTLRSPRYGALGGLALMAIVAVSNIDSSSGRNPAELADSLRSMAVVGVLLAGVFAATFLATEFQRGSAAMTYLSHPDRARVAAARALVYAGLGFLFAAVAAGVVVAVGLPAGGASLNAGFSATDVARMIGGAAAGGAVMGAAGALLGTAVPNPTIASGAFFAWNLVESLLIPADIRMYLPYGLLNSLMGGTGVTKSVSVDAGGLPLPAVIGLLLAYLAAGVLIVRQWALPRDLT